MIAIFGASVTKQKKGFATKLDSFFSDSVKVFGYGGVHINDGAICFIDNIISQKPKYCFFDWFSTAYNKTSEETVECIDTLLHKCSKINCKPIFLFLPFNYNGSGLELLQLSVLGAWNSFIRPPGTLIFASSVCPQGLTEQTIRP